MTADFGAHFLVKTKLKIDLQPVLHNFRKELHNSRSMFFGWICF
jgi:hypothetical protein